MSDFATYTPEMLVYYHALTPELQNAVSAMVNPPCTLEGLAALAEECAQSGIAARGSHAS